MTTKNFKKIAVIGAGVIGSGVAHLFAQSAISVVLVDQSSEQLETAKRTIAKNAKMFQLLKKGLGTPDQVLANLTFTQDIADIADAEFVIENITEDWGKKKIVHTQIAEIIGETIPVAANTSAIPITKFGSLYQKPDRVVGMHFMNPPPVMPMVEIINAVHSSEDALQAATDLVQQAGKQSITVNDSPGFVTNRVMMLMVNEAMFLIHEGVSTPKDVDRLFKTCFGHKMGPLETADLIGLDTVLLSLDQLYIEFNDPKYRPCPLLKQKVYAGLNGRKTGEGFFKY
ncbi:MAG: 3-hydroxybutyryl-CoA dehydrogenase [Candidatus Azotimanducaceae bacterium]|jgi:3-hydroxybutyryl-CoA dehydrogenase